MTLTIQEADKIAAEIFDRISESKQLTRSLMADVIYAHMARHAAAQMTEAPNASSVVQASVALMRACDDPHTMDVRPQLDGLRKALRNVGAMA